MPNLPDIQANLAFKCAYEKDVIPSRDPEADRLCKYVRWLEKNNQMASFDADVYRPTRNRFSLQLAFWRMKRPCQATIARLGRAKLYASIPDGIRF